MRFSITILSSALLLNAVFADESSQASSEGSASWSAEASSSSVADSLEKRDLFGFFHNLFYGSASFAEDAQFSSAAPAYPSSHLEKRDGNMQEVLESLANFYYASASLESAAMSIARQEWSSAPEEVASVIAEVSKQQKHGNYVKRDEASEAYMFDVSSGAYMSASEAYMPDVSSEAYLPVYYRRAKRHESSHSSWDGDHSSVSYHHHHHHHHDESTSELHEEEYASAEYFEAASGLEKRDLLDSPFALLSDFDISSVLDTASSVVHSIASEIGIPYLESIIENGDIGEALSLASDFDLSSFHDVASSVISSIGSEIGIPFIESFIENGNFEEVLSLPEEFDVASFIGVASSFIPNTGPVSVALEERDLIDALPLPTIDVSSFIDTASSVVSSIVSEIGIPSVVETIENVASEIGVPSVVETIEDTASKIAQDVQDQLDKILGKEVEEGIVEAKEVGKEQVEMEQAEPARMQEDAVVNEFAPVGGNIYNQQNNGDFWIADNQAEEQFKGYDWKATN